MRRKCETPVKEILDTLPSVIADEIDTLIEAIYDEYSEDEYSEVIKYNDVVDNKRILESHAWTVLNSHWKPYIYCPDPIKGV
jgi:hypothetical protein